MRDAYNEEIPHVGTHMLVEAHGWKTWNSKKINEHTARPSEIYDGILLHGIDNKLMVRSIKSFMQCVEY